VRLRVSRAWQAFCAAAAGLAFAGAAFGLLSLIRIALGGA